MALIARHVTMADRKLIERHVSEHFASPRVVSRERLMDARVLPGLVAESDSRPVGLGLFHVQRGAMEVVVLIAMTAGQGVGSFLLAELEEKARRLRCHRLWLITTNNNLAAIEFYKHQGWTLAGVHEGAVTRGRRLKPEIPLTDSKGGPITDEWEFERRLDV